MTTAISHSIVVSVEARFEPKHSEPLKRRFLYSYHISIENKGKHAVRLLRRHWEITDSVGPKREVNGDGVVGETPVIEPGKSYSYSSACDLTTDLGSMEGFFYMQDMVADELLKVQIPAFTLMATWRLN